MSTLIDNGDGTVTMSKADLKQLYTAYTETKADVELSVQTIAKVLQTLGMITPAGEMREDFRFSHLVKSLTSLLSGSIMGTGSIEKKFSFLTDKKCIDTIDKYAYLYNPNRSDNTKAMNITDIDFEKL